MKLLSKLYSYLVSTLVMLVVLLSSASAQDSDELFKQARSAAFDKKNYPLAIAISRQALEKSPGYTDIRIFLGRLYTWSDKNDSARVEFQKVLQTDPGNEDGSLAYASLEYWNDDYLNSLGIVNNGLSKHPGSKELLLLKAKILSSLNRYSEADLLVSELLKIDPKNTTARAMSLRIKDNSAKNKFGLSYDFVHFDKQFNDPWHLMSIDYGRQTKFGSVSTRINYANRFKKDGLQFELDAYPRISRTFYAYTSAGISGDGIFPNYRAGFSLYANLPSSFEADAGFRYLRFDSDTWIYTLSAGKYFKNYWFNLRTYLTPSNSAISHSYSFNVRYYFGGAFDYLRFGAGTGLSPDESANNVLIGQQTVSSLYKLKSNNINLGLVHSFKTFNIVSLNLSWLNQEYRRSTFGNQTTAAVSYQRRF